MRKLVLPFLFVVAFGAGLTRLEFRAERERAAKIHPESPMGLWQDELEAKIRRKAEGMKRPDEPDQFLRFHHEIRTPEGQSEPGYPANYRMIELEKAIQSQAGLGKRQAAVLPWVERGPGNVGGRTRGLILDPIDPTYNTWFAGSVGGGIWKTTNAGSNWINLTPNLPNLSTSALAMAESNRNIIYAGTGEGFGNIDAIRGDGIWKSTDRGNSWTQLGSTASNTDFSYINRIIVSPSDPNVVVVGTNTGIFRSTDGGSNWTKVYDGGRIQHVLHPSGNFSIQYAAHNTIGVLKSTNAGESWSVLPSSFQGARRIELAIAPSDANRILASVETATNAELYMSDNGGSTWNLTRQSSGTTVNWLGSQGWYDNTVAVHPFNKDIVYVGGIDVHMIQVQGGGSSQTGILGVDLVNTSSFLGFVNWGGPYAGGGIGVGKQFLGATNIDTTDYTSVEIRFGPGRSQMAHRFIRIGGGTYVYQNYVQVPFEVWDVTNNRQLMASFRDWFEDGAFDLIHYDGTNPQREYIFVHAVPYSSTTPSSLISISDGHRHKNTYAAWPILASGATWNPTALPVSSILIRFGSQTLVTRSISKMTNWYPGLSRPGGGTYPYVHADHHNLLLVPTNSATQSFRMINANDGGVEYSDDGGTVWRKTLNGFNTTQFYGADRKPGSQEYIGGMQDNGTYRSPASPNSLSQWTDQIGGDGFDVIWHAKNPNLLIAGSQYNNFRRSTNAGTTWQNATSGLLDVGSGRGVFINRLAKSTLDPDLVFAVGSMGIWRSDDFAESWTSIPVSTGWGFSSSRGQAAISAADPQVVWAGVRISSTGSLHVSTNSGHSFAPVTNYTGATLGVLSGLATHPADRQTAYALFSIARAPKILRTTNLGQSWTDISGFGSGAVSTNGFPDVGTYCLLVMPHKPSEIWVGTEIGLFISTDNGATWSYANNGIPAVSIWSLGIVDDEVIAATHGRGIWSVRIPELLTAPKPVVTLSPRLLAMAQGGLGALNIYVGLKSAYDSTRVILNGSVFTTLKANPVAVDTIVVYPVTGAATHTVQIVAYKGGSEFRSGVKTASVVQIKAPVTAYVDSMNVPTTNYTATGFARQLVPGFSTEAYHTPHPYANNQNYILQLNVPIIVHATNSNVVFDEVALVEPGDPGSRFGEEEFWDYCVVEGTKDGITWKPLADGYDADAHPAWRSAYDQLLTGAASLFRPRVINLRNTFSAGDHVLIRFRMFTDAAVTGWGWVIDNLRIQEGNPPLSVHDRNEIPREFTVAQNYPNPFNASTILIVGLPARERLTIRVYDRIGRLVATLADREFEPGYHTLAWNAGFISSGVYFYEVRAGQNRAIRKMTLLR